MNTSVPLQQRTVLMKFPMNTKLQLRGWTLNSLTDLERFLHSILTFNDPLCSGHLWLRGGVVGGGCVVDRHDAAVWLPVV